MTARFLASLAVLAAVPSAACALMVTTALHVDRRSAPVRVLAAAADLQTVDPVRVPVRSRAARATVRSPLPRAVTAPSTSPAPSASLPRSASVATKTAATTRRAMWLRLMACEAPDRGWRYGAPGVGADKGYERFEGAFNTTPETWKEFGGWEFARHAYDATPDQQITVAERILKVQGWRAWPVCSRKLGFR